MKKFRNVKKHTEKSDAAIGRFSSFLDQPIVSLSLLVMGLVVLMLSVLNFIQAVYFYP